MSELIIGKGQMLRVFCDRVSGMKKVVMSV